MTGHDDRIAAYLDGAMDEAEMQAFEAEMARDSDLAADVVRFGANDELLRAAFDGPMREPVDTALLERMGLAVPKNERQGAPGSSNVVALGQPTERSQAAANDNPRFWRRWQWPVGGAIAASLALVVVLQVDNQPSRRDGFSGALDETPSLVAVALGDGRTVTPQLTFAASDGRYCREYRIAAVQGSETGIACRSSGKWAIEARAAGGEALPGSDEIVSASGVDAAKLDAAYARLGASDPVDAASERALIKRKWSRP